jgi:hypothetical protein
MEEPTDNDLLKLGLTQSDINAMDAMAAERCVSRYQLVLEAFDQLFATPSDELPSALP